MVKQNLENENFVTGGFDVHRKEFEMLKFSFDGSTVELERKKWEFWMTKCQDESETENWMLFVFLCCSDP
jgi:hypothetical protein